MWSVTALRFGLFVEYSHRSTGSARVGSTDQSVRSSVGQLGTRERKQKPETNRRYSIRSDGGAGTGSHGLGGRHKF